jgi:hypothetical protein
MDSPYHMQLGIQGKNKDVSVERYKAELAARGFQQARGRDYDETFVAHMTSVRTDGIIVVATRSWKISQMDVKHAFLHGVLHVEIYMQPPLGVEAPLVIFVVFKRLSMGPNAKSYTPRVAARCKALRTPFRHRCGAGPGSLARGEAPFFFLVGNGG